MNRFKRLRILASMTAEEAAKRIGVSKSNVLHWEAGRTSPRVSRLKTIANVYGCSVADLIDDEQKETPL